MGGEAGRGWSRQMDRDLMMISYECGFGQTEL